MAARKTPLPKFITDAAGGRGSTSLQDHIKKLGAMSVAAQNMTPQEAAVTMRQMRISRKMTGMNATLFGSQSYKLSLISFDAILATLAEGTSVHDMAKDIGVNAYLLYQYIKSQPDGETRMKEALAISGFKHADQATAAIDSENPNPALEKHHKWRAERASPEFFGRRNAKAEEAQQPSFSLHIDLSERAQIEAGHQPIEIQHEQPATDSYDAFALLEAEEAE